MLVCDRCNHKITRPTDKTKKTLIIYSRQAAHIGNNVDLCDECLRVLDKFTQKAESYFMVNDDPVKLFDNVKYWSD